MRRVLAISLLGLGVIASPVLTVHDEAEAHIAPYVGCRISSRQHHGGDLWEYEFKFMNDRPRDMMFHGTWVRYDGDEVDAYLHVTRFVAANRTRYRTISTTFHPIDELVHCHVHRV